MRRIVRLVAFLLVFVVLVGATYQGVTTSFERREFPRPGGLVDVGGFQLHIYCVGTGSPVVVLEASAGSMSPEWGWVQPEVGRLTRVCSYDRAGLGWSETPDGRYVPSTVPQQLHVLLDQAHERGPFVLAGHELGAAFARIFASRYRAETAALVLVDDPTTSGQRAATAALAVAAWPWLARAGILRATDSLASRAKGLPGESGGAMRAFLNRPDHLTRAAMEIGRMDEVVSAARTVSVDPGIAVSSLTIGGQRQPAMIVARDDAARVSSAIEAAVTQVRQSPRGGTLVTP